MFVLRAIVERPVAGGEKFSVSIGPSRAARTASRVLWALTGASAAAGIALLFTGGGWAVLAAAGCLAAVAVGLKWRTGGPETLVCQGDMLVHRRRSLGREVQRTMPVLEILRIRPPKGKGRRAETRGLRIETGADGWSVGRGIPWVEANELADTLERHLTLSGQEILSTRIERRLAPSRSVPSEAPAQVRPDSVLRFRNPPPG